MVLPAHTGQNCGKKLLEMKVKKKVEGK